MALVGRIKRVIWHLDGFVNKGDDLQIYDLAY
jgi:hypothetical protein